MDKVEKYTVDTDNCCIVDIDSIWELCRMHAARQKRVTFFLATHTTDSKFLHQHIICIMVRLC